MLSGVTSHVESTGAGTCGSSANLGEMVIGGNWKNGTGGCASDQTSYTTATATGDYPDGEVFSYTAPSSGTLALTDDFDVGPLDGCTLEVDLGSTFTATGFSEDIPVTLGAFGGLYMEMLHDVGVDATPSGTPRPMQLNSAANQTAHFRFTGSDIQCYVRSASGSIVTVTTDGDTDCGHVCSGGGCDGVFADKDNTAFSVECRWDGSGSSDYVRLYIDGCLVDEDTTTFSTALNITSSHQVFIGDGHTLNTGGWKVGRWAVLDNTGAVIFTHQVTGEGDTSSSGTVDLTDGDECWCGDVAGGTDC